MSGHAPECQGIRHLRPVEGCELLDTSHYRAPGGQHHTGRHDCPEDVDALARAVYRPVMLEPGEDVCNDPTCSVCGQPDYSALTAVEHEAAPIPARRRRYRGPGIYELKQLAQLAGWLLLIAWLGAHW